MTPAELVLLAIKASMILLVFTIGIGTPVRDLTFLVRHPWQLIRSVIAMSLVMPIVAVAIVELSDLRRPVEITLIALALSPIPPLLPNKLLKAGIDHAYSMALFFTVSVLAIGLIPLSAVILDAIFPAHIVIPAGPVAKLVLTAIILPMLAGVAVRAISHTFAERVEGPLRIAAMLLLVAGALLILVKIGPVMLAQIGDGTLVALAAFVILGLAVGHLLGPENPADRTVLALATASRHPGIAIAIATMTNPDEKAVPATVLLYLIVGAILTTPYLIWRKRVMAAADAA